MDALSIYENSLFVSGNGLQAITEVTCALIVSVPDISYANV